MSTDEDGNKYVSVSPNKTRVILFFAVYGIVDCLIHVGKMLA